MKRLNAKDPMAWLRLPLALPVGGALRGSVDKVAAKHGVVLSPVLSCDSYIQAAAAVESGAVASVLPAMAAQALGMRGVQMLQLPELGERRHRMLMIWSKRVAATRASVSCAVEELPKLLMES